MSKPIDFHSISSYVVAEVGQNHQGSVDEALRYVSVFSGLGADAVKFQMRDNKTLISKLIETGIAASDW